MMTEELIEHELIQGSPEWLEFRMSHDGASEAAAMLGLSKKTSRTELLRMKSSGITKEFSAWVQENILDYGHEVEALARPIIEKQIGSKLYPVVCSRGRMSASCDGKRMAGDIGWEHKQWNALLANAVALDELPDEFMAQPQQCLLVTGADKWIFTVSDGTEENMVSMDILPDPVWFERIRAGWEQFNKDRENYQHVETKPEASGAPIKDLPAVTYEINGLTITSNIEKDVKPAVVALIEKFKRKPETDQDFADLDSFNKKARKAVVNSEATRATFKARFVDIDAFERSLIELEELLTKAAIDGEKTFKSEKDNRKCRIIEDGKRKYAEHIATLQDGIVGVRLVVADPDWVKAVYGLKTLDSYQNAVDTALANGKIAADAAAKDIRAKLTWCKETSAGYGFLFNDLAQIIGKPMDDFQLVVTSRIDAHKAAEAAKLEAEREAMRIEEEAKAKAKIEAEAAARAKSEAEAKAKADEEERAKAAMEAAAKLKADQDAKPAPIPRPVATWPFPLPAKSPAQGEEAEALTLGDVMHAVAPVSIAQAIAPRRPNRAELLDAIATTFGATNEAALEWILQEFRGDLNPVKKSSQVHSIGYDPTSKTMAVKFNSGGVYHYHDVPQEKFDAMRDAESAGSHLGKHIKGAHKFTKLDV